MLPPYRSTRSRCTHVSEYFIINHDRCLFAREAAAAAAKEKRYLSVYSPRSSLFADGAPSRAVADRRDGVPGPRGPGASDSRGSQVQRARARVRASLTARPWHPGDCIRPLRVDHVISWKWKRIVPRRVSDTATCTCIRYACSLVASLAPDCKNRHGRHQLPDICMSTRRAWNRVPRAHNRSQTENCRWYGWRVCLPCSFQATTLQFAYAVFFVQFSILLLRG